MNIGFNKIGKRTVLDIEVSCPFSFIVHVLGVACGQEEEKSDMADTDADSVCDVVGMSDCDTGY